MVRLVAALVLALNGWMLFDAYRRRADTYWLWIIVGVPGGAILYFFMVKLRDPGMQRVQRRLLSAFSRPPDLRVLRRRYERSKSIANRLTLAQGLGDAEQWDEARSHFAAILEVRPDDADALYGLGVCDLARDEPGRAVTSLQRLIDVAPAYREFAAYPELAEALLRAERHEECLSVLRALFSHPGLAQVLLLARYLTKCGRQAEAAQELRRALDEHEDAPRYVKRNSRGLVRSARRMLAELAG